MLQEGGGYFAPPIPFYKATQSFPIFAKKHDARAILDGYEIFEKTIRGKYQNLIRYAPVSDADKLDFCQSALAVETARREKAEAQVERLREAVTAHCADLEKSADVLGEWEFVDKGKYFTKTASEIRVAVGELRAALSALESNLPAPADKGVTMWDCEAFADHVMQYGLEANHLADFLRSKGIPVTK
jgi:hypothetical protein